MKLYKTTLTPISNFVTSLKGDTLFGQLCWSIRYLYGTETLKMLLRSYTTTPFLVVSDPFAPNYLPKPTLPLSFMHSEEENKKTARKKVWLSIKDLQEGHFCHAKTNKEAYVSDRTSMIIRTSINYQTFTSESGFDPYGVEETIVTPKDIYVLLDENVFTLSQLNEIFMFLSYHGYGKDTTVGKGRFSCLPFNEVNLNFSSRTVMALSPFSPEGIACQKIYYEPFTRFGKKGGERAKENPFKMPLLLADTGGVIHWEQKKNIEYIGQAITHFTSHDDIVHQGYAIILPIKELI